MLRVKQEDINGCGVACVAMLAKCSYKKAKDAFLAVGGNAKDLELGGRGTKWGILEKTAKHLGIKLNRGSATPRIVLIYQGLSVDGGKTNGHWVVIDGIGLKNDPWNNELTAEVSE